MQMTGTSTCSVSGASGTAAQGATCSAVTTINATYHTANSTTAKVKNDAIGLEGIFGYGPFKAQGEFMHMDTKGSYTATSPAYDSGINLKTDAYYLEALYMITGEKYADAYKKGAFGLVKPKNDFDLDNGKGLGAWEVGFRYDGFHVYDGSIASSSSYSRFQGTLNNVSDTVKVNTAEGAVALAGGIQSRVDSYTGGLKWILNPNMVLKGTYTYSKFNNPMQPIDIGAGSPASGNKVYDHESLLLIRGQYMF
jgi:phosphate-selective porin OprO/OprP